MEEFNYELINFLLAIIDKPNPKNELKINITCDQSIDEQTYMDILNDIFILTSSDRPLNIWLTKIIQKYNIRFIEI